MAINNITQTISTLPEAGRRGIDVQTQFVTKQEDFQDHLQGTTVNELNTLKDQLNSRIGEINSTTTTMNGYADTASTGASTATTKAGEASISASDALAYKNQAETFKNNASASATKASQWADNNYNVEVETGKYSAKHWSTVAQNTLANKIDKVTSTDNALARFDGVTGAVQNSNVTLDDSGNILGTSFNGVTGLSSTPPLVAGTASEGTATTAARANHVHPAQTSVTGSAGSVANSEILKFDTGTTEGTDLYTFNGSAPKTIDIKAGTNITLTKAVGSITINSTGGGGSGVSSSTLNAIPKFSNTTGTLANTNVTIDSTGNLTIPTGKIKGCYGSGNISSNIAIGDSALGGNTTGAYNIAIGNALVTNSTGSFNTAIGGNALTSSTTSGSNVAIGPLSLTYATTSSNTAIGISSLHFATTGANNTAIGFEALKTNIDTSNFTTFGNCTGVGNGSQVSGSNQVQLGNSSTTTYVYGTVQNRSDRRDKTDITDTSLGLDFIMKIRPVEYRWDMRDDYIEKIETVDEDGLPVTEIKKLEKDGSKARGRKHQGVIAQEVKQVIDELGVDFGGYQDHNLSGGCDVLSIGYDEFIAPLIKAIQEQQGIINQLIARVEALESK